MKLWSLVLFLGLCAFLVAPGHSSAEVDEEAWNNKEAQSAGHSTFEDGVEADADGGNDDQDLGRIPSTVYVMEHGFLSSADATSWLPRGTMMLSGAHGSYEARLSDAKEFVELKPELQQKLGKAASQDQYYAIRLYNPESPSRVLQAAIPADLLSEHFEDWHDILEVSVGAAGIPVGLSYRVKHTLGLMLFDHTQVHLSEPSRSEGPKIAPPARDAAGNAMGPKAPVEEQSFLRKYWWVVILVLLLVSNMTEEAAPAKGAAGGGGGGGGKAK